jgi:type IV pilus assembly protein PilC
VFDRVFVGLVRAGEQSGRMPEAFERLAASARWQDELAAQFRKMISYPAFTLAVLLGVTVFMLTYLVPQLAGFIRSTSGDLPLQTRLLLWLSQMLVAHWPLVLAAPVVAAITAVVGLRLAGERTRLRLDRLSLRTPLVGGVIQRIVLARFAALFGMLYASGVPVLKSLEVCEQAAGNRWIAAGIAQVQQAILQGKGLTDAFTQVGLFPNLVLRMVRIGEATGELDKALANVGYFYNREVQETIGRVQALVEPAMTVSLGLLLGWLMVSVLGPVYDLLTRIKV